MQQCTPMRYSILGLAIFASMLWLGTANAQQWDVPEEAKAEKSPIEPSEEVVAVGAQLFKKNCVMCHGDAGKGDGPATQFIKPAPPDITTQEAKERMSDGEIFFKITTGKKPMPAMNKKLTADERWQVVHYIRTLQMNE